MSVTAQTRDEAPFDAVLLFVFVAVGAAVSLLATAFTQDPLFRISGYIFLTAFLLAAAVMTVGLSSGRFRSDPSRYEDGVIRAGVIATMFWAVVGMAVTRTA